MAGFLRYIDPSLFTVMFFFQYYHIFSHLYMFLILSYKYVMYASYCAQSSTKQLIMSTKNTSLKNVTLAGDSNTTNEMVIGKINTYQRTFLIVAGSLLALLVLIAVAGTSGGQHLQSSAHEDAVGAFALSVISFLDDCKC